MRLLAEYQNIIRSDSMVTIQTAGLLGDRYVDITRGSTAGLPVADGGTLQGSDPGDIKQIITGTNDFIANLEVLSDQVRRMADRVDRGEGTLGKFLTDSAIYDNANLTVREANSLIRDARTGTGTIGRLISDDELHESFMALLTRVDTLVASLERGEGTAGKFLKDPAIANKTEQVITQVHGVMERIQRGEGTLGKLSQDDALYTDLRATMNRMNGLITSIENGEGTVGKLIKDPTLFNSANQATSEIQKLLYDFRADPKKFLTINFRLF
jgi:phospholipid/cholesterol/gamma-HCH transport system substrate-binding protein